MKKITILIASLFVLLQSTQLRSQNNELLFVEKLSNYENLYQSGDMYFSGQPNLETLKWLKGEGLRTIINLRSVDENKNFTQQAFSEEQLAKNFDINYISIPMKGKESFNPQTLVKFTKAMNNNNGKVLIHCKSGGRACYLMMAYLMQSKAYTESEAKAFGKQLTYFSALDALLEK